MAAADHEDIMSSQETAAPVPVPTETAVSKTKGKRGKPKAKANAKDVVADTSNSCGVLEMLLTCYVCELVIAAGEKYTQKARYWISNFLSDRFSVWFSFGYRWQL